MSAVRIKGTFRKDDQEFNGLNDSAEAMAKRPLAERVVVGIIDVSRITRDIENGTKTVTVRFRQIEVLDNEDAKEAGEMIRRACDARRGENAPDALPLDQAEAGF